MLPTMLMAQTTKTYQPAEAYGNLPPLHVNGKYLNDVNGNRVVLHGVMDTPSMWFNSNRWSGGYNSTGATNCINYFKKLFRFLTKHEDGAFCNVFRLHMDPAWTNQTGSGYHGKGDDFRTGFTYKDGKRYDPHGKEVGGEANIYDFSKKAFETYLKSVYVKLAIEALKAGMYVVVRPCGVCPGYIEVGDYYNDYLMYIWDTFSKNDSIRKYSGQISIELANEPVTLRAKGGKEDVKAKHDFFQPIVDKIRENGYDGIIWVPGTGWQASYEDYATYPIEGVNIGYAVHNYTGWYGNDDGAYDRTANKTTYKNNCINQFKKQVPVVTTNPIIITEVDWSPNKPGTGHYNEHGNWVESNYGTWATGSTSKWGVGYKAILDHFGNISMTLSSSDCYLDWNKSNSTGHSYPAFKDALIADGKDPYDASGVACFEWYADYYKVDYPHAAYKRQWTADQGYGYYINPILNGDFPDPDVVRVGDTYYMVSTSYHIFPGCTLMKSKDLVNWEYCANPLMQIDDNDNYNLLNGKNHYAQGQQAASLSYHEGKFYIYFNIPGKDGEDKGKSLLLTAINPEGKWETTQMEESYPDCGWLFDDGETGDGSLYVTSGVNDIYVSQLDAKTLKKISSKKVISIPDSDLRGCRMYHIGDYYYIYATYGDTECSQTVFRSQTPMGSYEECVKDKTDNNPNGRLFGGQQIHKGALVQTQTGEWWTILTKDAGTIGHLPYLEPVTWGEDGWPSIGKNGLDITRGAKCYANPNVGATYSKNALPTNDTFTDLWLGKQWGWNHNPDNSAWSLQENPGSLRLHTACVTDRLDQARNSLTQRILGQNPEGYPTGTSSSALKKYLTSYGAVKMDVSHMAEGDVAGLSVFQDPYSYIGVKVVDGKKRLVYYHSAYEAVDQEGASQSNEAVELLGDVLEGDVVFLRTEVNFYDNSCKYSYSVDNEQYTEFGNGMEMRLTQKYSMGQRFYLFNYATKEMGGYVDIDWFSTEPEYSEELFYGEGVLKTYTIEDVTAKGLKMNKQVFEVLPQGSQEFAITCTMLSNTSADVTRACTYEIADPSVAIIQGNKVIGVGIGSTEIKATYTDLTGNEVTASFVVNSSYFPLSADAINPAIIGNGTFKVTSTGLGQLKPSAKGMGGWHYEKGIDLRGKGRYLVVELSASSLARPSLVIYDGNDVQAENFFEADMTGQKEIVVDMEEVAEKVDLSHVYYVAFRSKNTVASTINIVRVFLSDDKENPTSIESVSELTVDGVVSTEFYSLDGRKNSSLQQGANIVRRTYSDGRVESIKVIK